MRIILVYPSNPSVKREIVSLEGSWPPIGLLYVATCLKDAGHEVRIFDNSIHSVSAERVVHWIKSQDPDLVGFSTLTVTTLFADKVAELLKQKLPEIPIVYGGYHASINHRRILKEQPFVDFVVRGEGESIVVELADALESRKNIDEIRGITYRENGRINVNQDSPLTEDINSIPFPDRSLLHGEYLGVVNNFRTTVKKFTTVMSSRGCPYNCTFCAASTHGRRKWRGRSAENIIEELSYLKDQGFGQIYFVDDSFTINASRVIELCKQMKKEKLDMYWATETRVDLAGKEMLWAMKQAGCNGLYFGIESAIPWILEYYRKKITPQKAKLAIKNCNEVGMDSFASFIMGAPGETVAEMWTTIRFASKIGVDIPDFHTLGAAPGMPIWDELVSQGYINEDKYWRTGVAVPDIVPNAVPREKINELIKRGFRLFLTSPKYLTRQLKKTYMNSFRREVIKLNTSLNSLRRFINFY